MHYLGMRHKSNRKKPFLKKIIKRRITVLDRITFVAGVIGPFTILPQIYTLFIGHDASGVSLLSWILIFAVTLPWVFYGIVHRDKSITISYILWEIVNAAVIVGVILYK